MHRERRVLRIVFSLVAKNWTSLEYSVFTLTQLTKIMVCKVIFMFYEEF